MSSNNLRSFLIGTPILIMSIVAAIYAFAPFNRYKGIIPLFCNKDLNNSIQYYVHTRPTRGVLIVSGTKGSGKSTMLNHIAEKLENEGRFVVNINAFEVKTFSDLIEAIKIAVAVGLDKIYNVIGANGINGINEINDRLNKTITNIPVFPNSMLQKVYAAIIGPLENVVNEDSEFDEMSVKMFFDSFEDYEKILRPVLIFQNIENVIAIEDIGQKLKEAVIARLIRRDLYNDYVPILIEVKNSINLHEIEQLNSFQINYRNGLKDAYNKYVRAYKIFSYLEFKKIQNVFGNHQGTFSRIFENIRYGIPIDSSIATIQKEISDTIHSANITQIPPQICSNSNKIIFNKDEIHQMNSLFENGYLSIKNGLYVKFMNKEVRKVLCSLLRK